MSFDVKKLDPWEAIKRTEEEIAESISNKPLAVEGGRLKVNLQLTDQCKELWETAPHLIPLKSERNARRDDIIALARDMYIHTDSSAPVCLIDAEDFYDVLDEWSKKYDERTKQLLEANAKATR